MGIPMPKPYAFTKQQMHRAWNQANYPLISELITDLESNLKRDLKSGKTTLNVYSEFRVVVTLFINYIEYYGWPVIGTVPTPLGLRKFSDKWELKEALDKRDKRSVWIEFEFDWSTL